MAVSSDLIGKVFENRYRIEQKIARGGMATVYSAWDLRLSRTVAVKVMHPSLAEDPAFLNRFEREARAAASLSHPHVVSVHDAGRDEATNSVFLVMEYVNGQSLREVIAARGSLTPSQALGVLDPVLQGLDAAHRAGFVHRDMKPENILISDDGRIKVTDFGLARAAMDGSATAATTGVLIGTVAYIAPEQVTRGSADERSDLYSLGITLYELLTGKVPFTAETPIAVAFAHVHNDLPALQLALVEAPTALSDFVSKLAARNPADRFQNSAAALSKLREVRKQIDGYTPVRPTPDFQQTEIVARENNFGAETSSNISNETTILSKTSTTTPKRKSKLRRYLILLLVSSLAAAGIYGYSTYRATRAIVPQLIGQNIEVATAELQDLELAIAITSEVFDETIAAGIILDANPESGEEVARGTVVSVVVSKGPEVYAVPDLTGKTLDLAESELLATGFKVGVVERTYSQNIPRDEIISASPNYGELLKPGSKVDLLVSDGPAPIPVPDVIGLKLETARTELSSAGFPEITVVREYSETVPVDSVIRTDPKPAKLKQPGFVVKVVVSDGPPPVEVPQLVGMTRTQALAQLESLGLIGKVVSANTCPKGTSARNKVVQQQLTTAGTMVPRGTTVELMVYVFCA